MSARAVPQDYLRVSVTDRCDFRCLYCLPHGLPPPQPRASLLTYEEQAVAAAALDALQPLAKIRLTGGEPLLRRDLHRLVALLAALPSRPVLALTTNGIRLAKDLPSLMGAGLTTVNVSIDHPDPDRFSSLTGGGDLGHVLEGLRAAKAAGISPLRINAVVTRSTLGAVGALLDLAVEEGADLRLIEMMPFGDNSAFFASEGVHAEEILQTLSAFVGEKVAPPDRGRGPARDHRIPGTRLTAGVIAAHTDPGCADCSRLRMSSAGRLSVCLFERNGLPLLPYLRPLDPPALRRAISRAVGEKRSHNPLQTGEETWLSLSEIGG